MIDSINLEKGSKQSNVLILPLLSLTPEYSKDFTGNNLVVTLNASGNEVLICSNKIINCLPGNKVILYMSGILAPANIKGSVYIGYYNTHINTGIYFKSLTSSYPTENSTTIVCYGDNISRSEWNYDKLDGNGISKLNINFANNNIFIIEKCSNGPIKFGIYINSKIYYCHIITNLNINLNNQIMLTYYFNGNNGNTRYNNDRKHLTFGSAYVTEYGPKAKLQKYKCDKGSLLSIPGTDENVIFQLTGRITGNYYPNIYIKKINIISTSNDIIMVKINILDGTYTSNEYAPVNNGYFIFSRI